MKKLFYMIIKYTFKFASHFYFRKIKIYGLENIPKEGGVLFSPNHQGAFLDPLLVGCNIPKRVTSLTRSDVFGGPFQWFLDALSMLPVYRIRNGYASLKKNEAIFEKCKRILSSNQWVMMFSEASHHSEYYLQSLSKGSSRLAYEAQEASDNPVYIVPVGINYGHHIQPFCDLHLVFGTPIALDRFKSGDSEKPIVINKIRTELSDAMKKCMWLPVNDDQYPQRKKFIHPGNTRLAFDVLKKGIHEQSLPVVKSSATNRWVKVIISLFSLPNQPPLFALKKILQLFDDIVFYSSIKICAGLVLFSLWWGIILLLSTVFWGWKIALINAGVCVALLYIRQILSNKTYQ
ncbi:MAG: lysophospholipid acyltransferase family protein [Flavobacteriaceae bacterium]